MINGVYLSTMGALVQAGRHGIIANNLANANTVGFKPDIPTFRELLPESRLQPGRRIGLDELLEQLGGGAWLNSTSTDFSPGSFRVTGNPLNAAIVEANGFFEVEKNGERFLTRDGAFTLNSDGELVLSDGVTRVLDQGGVPIVLQGSPVIRENGAIEDEDTLLPVAQLSLVTVDNLGALEKRGDNLYRAGEAQVTQGEVRVMGGAVEESAVNPIREMAAMIEAARAYQANMRLITIQDEILGRVVSTVGSIRTG
ncbi:MAG: flagellar hook-basal body protein [Planctomycetota bacterium]